MKLHKSVVDKLIHLYSNFGGFPDEKKLREHIERMDLTVYERKTTADQELVLVLTEEYVKQLHTKK